MTTSKKHPPEAHTCDENPVDLCSACLDEGYALERATVMPHTDHLADGVEYEEGCPACELVALDRLKVHPGTALFNQPNVPSPEKAIKDEGRDKRHPSIREAILGEAGYLSDELYGSSRVNPDAYAEFMHTWLQATNDRKAPAKVVLSIIKCLKAISAISKDPHNTENYISLAANAAIAGEHAQRSKPIV